MKRYIRELAGSRQHKGDGLVVCVRNRTGTADVYWSNDNSCWIIVDRHDDNPKVRRVSEIALVRYTGVADLNYYAALDIALASDSEDEDYCVYVLPADQVESITGPGSGIEVLWRSDRP